jgi:hypothetical protein
MCAPRVPQPLLRLRARARVHGGLRAAGGASVCPAAPGRQRGRRRGLRARLKSAVIDSALRDMGVTLCKGVAWMMRESLGRVARGSGNAFMRGVEVPEAEVAAVGGQSDVGPSSGCCGAGVYSLSGPPACCLFSE